jgi:hypothetical protein
VEPGLPLKVPYGWIKAKYSFMDDDEVTNALWDKVIGQPLLSKEADDPYTIKPYFYLNVGPPKTATTTLQCTLQEYSKQLAELDHLYFLEAACNPFPGRRMPNGEVRMLGGIAFDLNKEATN